MPQLPNERSASGIDETDIAVIGMAGRFPGARNLAEFWANVAAGVESIRVLTADELAAAGVPAAVREAPGYVPVSSRLDEADCFDAPMFGYSPREAALMDPQSRVCLELAWHALEDAGYSPLDMGASVGVFASASLCTYLLQNLSGQLDPQDFVLGLGNIPIVLGNGADFIATRVSYKLNLRGPSIAVQTACSSSLTAIHLARQSLLTGECDMALAGGVSIYLPQDRGYLHQDGMILSADGHCRPFDADASGIVFGRGGGIVVLKPLARALADGDRIRAVIKGSAANNDGARKVGFTAPSVAGQSRVIAEALADAGLRADAIGYVEAHGTGTSLGDPIEMAALTEAYRKHTPRTGFCAIGTVKANIGHLDVAAGVTGFIKTVLMLEHRQIPPSLHFHRPNPAIDFAASPFFVNTALRPWDAASQPRRAGVSAFGIGGTNVHVILEEGPPLPERAPRQERPFHVMRLTARTDEALTALCARMDAALGREDAPDLGDACFTANIGRAHLAHRAVVRGTSTTDLRDALRSAVAGDLDPRVVRGVVSAAEATSVAFLFPGLGAQSVGMGRALFDGEPVFRAALEQCDALLRPHLPKPLLRVLYPAAGETSPIEETTYGQPVTVAFEYALAMLWRSWGVRPAAVIGHSLGEYAAACVAGLLPLHEALRLVATRATLADTLPPGGGMTAVFASESDVRDAIGADAARVAIASINSPESIVLSGAADAVARVAGRLAARGVDVRVLKVSQAFHSVMLDPILDRYERAVAGTTFGRAEIPVISNVTGLVLTDADGRDPRYWRRHAREVVRFADGMRTLHDRGIRTFLEVGPHTTATAMAAGCLNDDGVCFVPSLRRGRDDWDQILETVSELYARGVSIDWAGMDSPSTRQRVALPAYPFARTRHWIEPAARPAIAEHAGGLQYPMLGRGVSSPLFTEPAFEIGIDPAAHPFLRDHRIGGAQVFPATGYLEAAFEAMERASGRRAAAIEDLEIPEALTLTGGDDRQAQIILTPHAHGFTFDVYSRTSAAGAWARHATGRLIEASPMADAGRLEVDEIAARCGPPSAGAEFYGALAAQGFEYGPLFQGIESLRVGDGEVLASVRRVSALESDAVGYRFHPALLDACLQISLALAPADRTFLPIRLGRVQIGDWQPELTAHAVRRPAAAGGRGFECDVRIADAQGRIIASVTGIVMQEASVSGGLSPAWERWMYEPTWRTEAASKNANAIRTPAGTWLIVGDASDVANRMAARVTAAGGRAGIATTASVVHACARAIDEATAGAPLDGVIYLGGVDADGAALRTADVSPLLMLVQALGTHASATSARLWIATRDAQAVIAGDGVAGLFASPQWGLANVISLEHPELRCSCIDLDILDAAVDATLWQEVSARSTETRVAIRGGVRYVQRLARLPVRRSGTAPSSGMRRLESREPGLLDDLQYVDAPRRVPLAGDVEIEVYASGLNFKDVLTALGRFPSPPAGLGHECTGVISAVGAAVSGFSVGDAVVAFAPGSLATHVIADARLVALKPASLSFEQAATVAGGFLTAYHALHGLAGIGPGDRVLIHAATGGVGLAAVQLARRAGATVFATAGSEAKRARLTSMGVAHVFSSRTTDFAAAIDRLTEGRGVTVVLNSLTGEMLDRSAALMGDGGRFVELGRGADGVVAAPGRLRRDAVYFNPDVAGEAVADPSRVGPVLREILAGIDRGDLAALPSQVFDAADTIEAFRLMARAGHVGKVVVRQRVSALSTRIQPDATYLIVGGVRGIGVLVAHHLAGLGARHLVLMTRRAAGAEERAALARLTDHGVQVRVLLGDVSRRADVDAVLHCIAADGPPLGGIVQSAGVLDDGVLLQQTAARFAHVMAPKVTGSWHLHEATRHLDLDVFVMFSSIASLLGSQGQGNHAAANAFLDALAAHRRAQGLAALSINWGAWASVGAAASRNIGGRIAGRGLGEMAPADAIAAMDHAIGRARPQIGIAPIDWRAYRRQFADGAEPPFLLDVLAGTGSAARASRDAAPATAFADRVRGAVPGERRGMIARFVREQVARGLGLDLSRPIDEHTPLVTMGLDSLLAVELRNALNRGLQLPRRLPATLLFDYPSISALTEHLLATIVVSEPAPHAAAPRAPAPAADAATRPAASVALMTDEAQIAAMTDEEAEALLMKELG